MKIEVSATGRLKSSLSGVTQIEVPSAITLNELKVACGIEKSAATAYVVNGLMGKGSDQLKDGDIVKFVMIVGAG